eukprot:GHVS01083606.1.p1 GENE.GHVS01083606.1~~GHVS01083606.1.p1  ORF type:complete len:264 (+),score=55.71 GHVS01083606.1:125-916(+)
MQLRWQGNPLSPSLADVHISARPRASVTGGKKSGRQAICSFNRQVLIAMLPDLTTLNGGPVSKMERTNGERYFMSLASQLHPVVISLLHNNCRQQVATTSSKCQQQQRQQQQQQVANGHKPPPPNDEDDSAMLASQIVQHPVIVRLSRLHGAITPAAPSATGPVTLQASLIQIALKPDCSSGYNRGSVVKQLPSTMTVRDLRLLCSRLFGVPPVRVALRLSEDGRPVSIELSEEDHQLSLYGLSSGCSVYVQDTAERSTDDDV